MDRPLRIVQVNASERGGGAEAVALSLHEGYRQRGHHATMLVGRGGATQAGVRAFPSDLLTTVLHTLAGAARVLERAGGLETYRYPASARGLEPLLAADVIHFHNLHGGYFDLRLLASISERVPVVLTLHDAWLLSGHCAHSFDCGRWRTGCGSCPDLGIYPAIRRDATARNWQRKKSIYEQSRLYVATPSQWLEQRVRDSMLNAAVVERRVIPNGVDLAVFSPGDRAAARRTLGLSAEVPVVLAVGSAARDNPFKDPATADIAVTRAAELIGRDIAFVRVGGATEPDRTSHVLDRPYESDATRLALYFRAADVYVHSARADTFPSAVIEAMACGTAVVATAVGGIGEQVRSIRSGTGAVVDDPDATGVLVAPADAGAMAGAIAALLGNDALRRRLGHNAACVARKEYDRDAQCDTYLSWYRSLVQDAITS